MPTTTVLRRAAATLLASGLLLGATATRASGQIRAQLVVDRTVNLPIDVSAPGGDTSRLFITEQTGIIKILSFASGTVTVDPAFLDISLLIDVAGERGMLGMAFHPDYANNGYFYVSYTDLVGDTIVARYTANVPYASASTADRDSVRIVLTVPRVNTTHNGGHLAFGPDGMLYISQGDGSLAQDQPLNNAQNINVLLGKLLRVDVDRDDFPTDPLRNYGIPAGNPFAGATPGADEIWAFGLRNPWRFSFDRDTGDMWIGDVGQDTREEIDFQPALTAQNLSVAAGRNYGWNCREGTLPAPFNNRDCSRAGTYIEPVYDYTNGPDPDPAEHGCAVMGGVVYRGNAIPSLRGVFFYADLCGQWIHSLRYDGTTVSDLRDWTIPFSTASGPIQSIVGFGEDAAGEVYIISLQGEIYKIVSDEGSCGCPCILTDPQGTLFADDFQSDQAWTGSSIGGATGLWQRGVPINDPSDPSDPLADSDGSGNCFVTGNSSGSDVDGGSVMLLSPALDFTRGQVALCFDYYLSMTGQGPGDGLFVEVSDAGPAGPWTPVASYTASNGAQWTHVAITPAQLAAAGVPNQANMRVRFIASDAGADSTVEAGLDSFNVNTGSPFLDCNDNGIDDAADITAGSSTDCNLNGIPDECDIVSGLLADADGGPVGVRSEGSLFFNTACVGCHGTNGTGATGPNIRNKSRTVIKARLTYSIPHPGGTFPNLTLVDFANIEAFLADGGSRGRPDGIPDTCQALPDCDGNGTSDGAELQVGTQADLDYDGIPDGCQPPCPRIATAPQSLSADADTPVVIVVATVGAAPLEYRWFKDGVPLTNSGRITNATTGMLRIDPTVASDAGRYVVRVTNSCGTVETAPIPLTIGPPLGTASNRRLRAVGGQDGAATIVYSSTLGRPVLLEKPGTASPWLVSAADRLLDLASPATDTLTWTDPQSLHAFAAVLTGDGTFIFDTVAPDTTDANLTVRIPGATAIAASPTVFTSADGSVHVAGIDAAGDVVLYFSTGLAEPNDWAFSNLSRDHLTPQSIPTPTFVGELAGYGTPWNGRNLAGLDAAGRIFAVWWAPGMSLWRADDISTVTGTPPLRGPLTAFTTSWGGLNLAGTDDRGHVFVTWWAPALGSRWEATDLSDLVLGPTIRAGSMTSYVTPWGAQNIAGVGPDGSVEIYWWVPGMSTWAATNLTAAIPGAEKPQGALTGVASPTGATDIFGTNSEGGVFRYHWHPGVDWTAENISNVAVPR